MSVMNGASHWNHISKSANTIKQEMIDKACDWLYDWNQKQAKMYGAKATLSVIEYTIDVNAFRKAMEE